MYTFSPLHVKSVPIPIINITLKVLFPADVCSLYIKAHFVLRNCSLLEYDFYALYNW